MISGFSLSLHTRFERVALKANKAAAAAVAAAAAAAVVAAAATAFFFAHSPESIELGRGLTERLG